MSDFPRLPPHEIQRLRECYRRELEALSPALGVQGEELLAAHSPQQWPAEWHLPWWLATSLGLTDGQWRALAVCNLLGLGFVRLQDQLVEGSANSDWPTTGVVLASALHESALARLGGLFASTPEFWEYRRAYMAQWLRSLLEGDRQPGRPFAQWQQEDFARLAWRGAPLKITATGACLLAGQPATVRPLATALDHMLIAQVLLDHAEDWPDDLPGQRFNAFVACASELPQTQANAGINQRRVLGLLMLGDPVGVYFSQVEVHIDRARAYAAEAGCAALVDFLSAFQIEARAQTELLVEAARHELRYAVRQLLVPADRAQDQVQPEALFPAAHP